MEEKSVCLLQLVEVRSHRQRGAIEILLILRRTIGLHLYSGDHVHVIDPITRLGRDSIRRCLVPLLVGQAAAEIEILLLFALLVNL